MLSTDFLTSLHRPIFSDYSFGVAINSGAGCSSPFFLDNSNRNEASRILAPSKILGTVKILAHFPTAP